MGRPMPNHGSCTAPAHAELGCMCWLGSLAAAVCNDPAPPGINGRASQLPIRILMLKDHLLPRFAGTLVQ